MNLSITAIAAKFELPYLKEWIDYHMKIVDRINLGLNNWKETDIPDWLKAYPKDRLQIYGIEGNAIQIPFYNHIMKSDTTSDWTAFIDIDEFINPIVDIRRVLEYKDKYDSVYMNWRIYGDSNQHFNGDYSVLSRFTMADSKLISLGKHIVNMKHKDKIIFYDPHIMVNLQKRFTNSVDTVANQIKGLINTIEPVQEQYIELAHFRNKTIEEHIARKYHQPDCYYGTNEMANDLSKIKSLFQTYNKNEIKYPIGDTTHGRH